MYSNPYPWKPTDIFKSKHRQYKSNCKVCDKEIFDRLGRIVSGARKHIMCVSCSAKSRTGKRAKKQEPIVVDAKQTSANRVILFYAQGNEDGGSTAREYFKEFKDEKCN